MIKNHINTFQITLKQQLLLLSQSIILWLCIVAGCFFILKINLSDKAFIYIAIFIFIIDTLPTIILHVQYWVKNHNVIFILNTEKKDLSYERSKKKLTYSYLDIRSLIYFRNLGKGSGWNSFAQYRYYKIIVKDNTEIIITCLMINDIENTIPMLLGMKAEWQAKLLCLIE